MPETLRTEAELLTIFADNTSGDISAQDGRDFIFSIYNEDRKGQAKVSANDTTKNYLSAKLVAGTGIDITENNDGGDETLTIDATGGGGGGTVQGTDGTYDIQATDDGTPDGDARGENSIDLQTKRASATQVAVGVGSFIIAGENNKAAGLNSGIAGGKGNVSAGIYSFVGGGQSNVSAGDGAVSSGNTALAHGAGSVAAGKGVRVGHQARSFTISGTTVTIAGIDVTNEYNDTDTVTVWNLTGGSNNTLFATTRTITSTPAFGTDTTFDINSALDDRTAGTIVDQTIARGSLVFGWSNTNGNINAYGQSGNFAHGTALNTATLRAYGSGSFVGGQAAGTSSMSAQGEGAIAHGNIVDGTMTAGSAGSVALGHIDNAGAIYSSANGSFAHGNADAGIITASGVGSFAHGSANGGNISAIGGGGFVGGNAQGSGVLYSGSAATFVFGEADSSGTIYATSNASIAMGRASGSSSAILSGNQGTFAIGSAYGGGTITATTEPGAFAIGYARNNGSLSSIGRGSFAGGYAYNNGSIQSTGLGSRAGGAAYAGNIISGPNKGSWAFGYARYSSEITAGASGSHASGYAQTYSIILAAGEGSHAEGYAYGGGKSSGYGVVASGKGSHAEGYAGTDARNTIASGKGAHAEGWNTHATGDASHSRGLRTLASGMCSTAAGYESSANRVAQVSLAGGMFSNIGDAQTSQYVLRALTTNATQTEMNINGSTSNRLVLPDDTTWAFHIMVVARRTDANDESASYIFDGAIDRNSGAGTTALIGTPAKTVNEDTAAWDVTVDANTTQGALRIQVTGQASKTIHWVAFVRTVETTG